MKKTFVLAVSLIFLLLPLAAQTITVNSPNGGENWVIGSTASILWISSDVPTVRIVLYKGGTAAENRVGVIANGLQAATGGYSWLVGDYIGGTVSAGGDYYIRVRSESDTTDDISAAPFILSNPPPPRSTMSHAGGNDQ
ncbi:MAG TPA: Ser-Thr-rich GPI-anchored membrane family protein [Acidobacteriota bacterium]